jgi:hypothetical protein
MLFKSTISPLIPARGLLLALVFSVSISQTNAQESNAQFPEIYDEIFVYLSVENLGYYEIDAIYAEDRLYLPVLDLFNKLKVYTEASPQLDTIQGYVGDLSATYLLDFTNARYFFREKSRDGNPSDFLNTYGDVFVDVDVFDDLFGFHFKLDFRSLTVFLTTDAELPVVKMLRIQKMRQNLRTLEGETPVDSVIARNFHLAKGAVADWNIQARQASNAAPSYQFQTAIGTELLGGELVMRGSYTTQRPFDWKSQSARWRFVNDSSKVIRQINAGFIGAPLNSQVTTPLVGMGISNTPVGFRKSYGKMMVQRTTQPNWEVEVFINNVLVGFATADANGDFQMEVPLMYGNNALQIRYYGPYGEEEIEEQVINIPFVFVPKNKLEYQLFSGVALDTVAYRFAFGRVAYGINKRATINAGYEFFDRNVTSREMPFVGASFVIHEQLLFNINSVPNASHSASMMFRTRGGQFFEAESRVFEDGQDAELITSKQEHTASFNTPLMIGKTRINTRGRYRQMRLISQVNHFADLNISTFLGRFNLAFFGGGLVQKDPSFFGGINGAVQLPRKWSLQGGVQGVLNTGQLTSVQSQIQKRFNRRVVASVNIASPLSLRETTVGLNVFVDLGQLTASAGGSYSSGNWQGLQTLSGSALLSSGPTPVQSNSRSTMGRGAVDIMVFVDVNHNNKRDKGEPLVKGMDVSMNRGIESMLENDSITRYVALQPYTRHLITVSDAGLPNIAWRLPYQLIGVSVDVNSVKKVHVPVKPMSEIDGFVQLADSTGRLKPLGRMAVQIIRADSSETEVARIVTDRGGYYTYPELPPGDFIVRIDPEQLAFLNYSSSDPMRISITPSVDGMFIPDVNFTLRD